ncbi:hypothetical protein ONZ45_g19385 [Pleurotus djamor]|nr:hypothetical protein ONZ45_g19385 [Pleurotus djamor]
MDSPYINDIDLQPPSPSDAQATFDSFDFNGTSYAQQSPNSYNGSYNGSPYSGHSELSFGDDNLNAINNQGPSSYGLFDDGNDVLQQQQRNAGGALGLRDYDPSDFDPPNSSSSLLMFDNDYMTPYELPASMPHHHSQDHRIPFDYSSPSSNGGDSANEDARSRASSVSSNPHTPGHALSSPPPPHISPSPRLGVAQNLENLSFNSPSWGTVPLPQQHHEHGNNGNSNNFRENKAQSPPRLLMPDSSLQAPPIINAPDGDGHDGHHGPSLNIVPATPISGMAHAAQFQNRLETVSQGVYGSPCTLFTERS